MNDEENINIVKRVCKELGLTYKQLGENIGIKPDTLRTIASKDEISIQIETAIKLYVENVKLKNRENKIKDFFTVLEEIKQD